MSTKIYNGFRLTITDWGKIHREVMKFRKELADQFYKTLCIGFARDLSLGIDRRKVRREKRARCPYVDVMMETTARMKEDPVSFDITLLPYRGSIYGCTFGRDDWHDSWMKKTFVSEFVYWNNTDRPGSLSDKEWNDRSRLWDRIIENRSWAMSGFTAQCIDPYGPLPRIEDVLPLIGSLEERANRLARDRLIGRWVKRKTARKAEGDSGNLVVSIWIEGHDWLRTEDGRAAVTQEASKICPRLDPVITKEIAQGFPREIAKKTRSRPDPPR